MDVPVDVDVYVTYKKRVCVSGDAAIKHAIQIVTQEHEDQLHGKIIEVNAKIVK